MRHTISMMLFATCGISAPAFAQEAARDIIIVTAQKREQSLQDVPASVTAIGGNRLQAEGVTDISTLAESVPGLQFGQSGTDARPSIRGARTENVSVQQDPVVAFYVDGVYRSVSSQALAAITDVERVEVLRGPQGTLYGRNSFGGAINVISKAPESDFSYGSQLTLGNYDRVRAEGYVNVPLGDTLAFRLTASVDEHDPIIENNFDVRAGLRDKDETYVRAQLRWQPTDWIDATIRASHLDQAGRGNTDFGYALLGTPIDPSNDGNSITAAEVLNAQIDPTNPRDGAGGLGVTGDPFTINSGFRTDLDAEQDTIDLDTNIDLGWADLRVILAYADFSIGRTADADFSSLPAGFSGQFDDVEAFSQDIQLTSSGDRKFDWLLGFYALQEEKEGLFVFDRFFEIDDATNRPTATPATAFFADFIALANVDTDSVGVYGQAEYEVTDRLNITAGVRYTRDEKDFSRVTNGIFSDPVSFVDPSDGSDRPVLTDDATFDEVTWRLAADYRVNSSALVYASASTGFQSGGFNNSADSVTGGASFEPQTVTAYEAGVKSGLFANRLTLNAALFYNQFEDLLAQEFVNVGATTLAISTNAGEADAFGLELEADYQLTENFQVFAAASFNQAEFGDYFVTEPVSGEVINLDGSRIPLTPDATANIGMSYNIALPNGGELTPFGSVYYSSSYGTNDIDYRFAEQEAYATLDLRLTYRAPSRLWEIEAFGNNITNEEIVNRTVRFGQNAIVQNFADPTIYGFRFRFRSL